MPSFLNRSHPILAFLAAALTCAATPAAAQTPPLATLRDGRITLDAAAGLGIEPDIAALRAMCERASAAA